MQYCINLQIIKPMEHTIENLLKAKTETLRDINGEIIKDILIALKDKIALHSVSEDIREAPEDYSYSSYEFEMAIFALFHNN